MSLVGNGIRLASGPGRFNVSGTTFYVAERVASDPYGARKNVFIGEGGISNINGSQPSGVGHPYAWLWAIKAGGLASRNIISGSGTLAADLYLGKDLAADLEGSCTITAGMDLVTSLAADLEGTCTITAGLDSTTALAADLSGSGTVTAGLSLIVDMIGALSGTGTITAGLTGTLDMEADLSVSAAQDFPTADETAAAVMASIIESGYDLREVLALIAARELGECSGGPTSPAWKGLDGTTTRVTGTVDTNGNRTGITLTPG